MKKDNILQIIFPVILIIICLSFNLLLSYHYSNQLLSYDQKLYNTIAIALLHGDNFYMEGLSKLDIGIEVTPFYSSFVAMAYFIGGININNVYILNILLNCLSIILIYNTIKLINKDRFISFLFSCAFIFYYPLWRMNFSIVMEITTVFFLTLTIFLFTRFFYEKKLSFLYLSTLTFSILCLINNRFIVLFSFFFLFLIFLILKRETTLRKGLMLPAIITILVLSPWFIRQYTVYHQFVFFTPTWNNVVAQKIGILKTVDIKTDADENTITETYKYEKYLSDLKGYNTEAVQQSRLNAFTKDKYNQLVNENKTKRNIYYERLRNYFTFYYSDFRFVSSSDQRLIPPSTKPQKLIQILYLIPLFILALIGFVIAIWKREYLILFLSGLFFLHVFLHVLIHFIERYRLTILPLLVIIAAYGLSGIITNTHAKNIFKLIRLNVFGGKTNLTIK